VQVILALIVIEGLLSVDNALAIAAMASHLPGKQKMQALRYGIIGAYFFRGLCLAFAAWIIEQPWVKLCGAAYLLYLMSEHFTGAGDEDNSGTPDSPDQRGFWSTILAIEVMDLSLSVDNVVAAVAMSDELWVVCTGVFIGILALRFVAGACIRLIEKFPILADTAFVLIGFVGALLMAEILSEPGTGFRLIPVELHISTTHKFGGIVAILAVSIACSKVPAIHRALGPLIHICQPPMRVIAILVGIVIKILLLPIRLIGMLLPKRPKGAVEEGSASGDEG
jgi:YkoY family integral membrane protein